MKIRSLSP